MTNKQRRRVARHLKRLQNWLNIEMRVWRKYEQKVHGAVVLYNSYAVWRSTAKHLRTRILKFLVDNTNDY